MKRTLMVAAAALTIAGCSSTAVQATSDATKSSPTVTPSVAASSPAAMSKTDAGAKYVEIVGAANAAIKTMTADLQKLPDSATGPDAAKITTPAADAIDAACEKLLRVEWPGDVGADVKDLVTAFKTTANDLRSVSGQDAFSIGSWETQLASDAGKASAASSIVRADLGLPPLS